MSSEIQVILGILGFAATLAVLKFGFPLQHWIHLV